MRSTSSVTCAGGRKKSNSLFTQDPPAPARRVLYDRFVGTPGSKVSDRPGWVCVAPASTLATAQTKVTISASGKGMVYSDTTTPLALTYDTQSLSHSVSVRLNFTTSFSIVLSAALDASGSSIVNNGVMIRYSEQSSRFIIYFIINGVTVKIINLVGSVFTALPFRVTPLAVGEIFKFTWDNTNSKVLIYKNGYLVYTSIAVPELTVRTTKVAFLTDQGSTNTGVVGVVGGFEEVQAEDANTSRTVTVKGHQQFWKKDAAGGVRAPIQGSFTGLKPQGIEYRVLGKNRTVFRDWDDLTSVVITDNSWSGFTKRIPDGGPYILEFRGKGRVGEQDLCGVSVPTYVGNVIAMYGGNISYAFAAAVNTSLSTTVWPGAIICIGDSVSGQFANSSLQAMCNALTIVSGAPTLCYVVNTYLGGLAITNYAPGSTNYNYIVGRINSVTGNTGFTALHFFDSTADAATDPTSYRAQLTAMVSGLYADCGIPSTTPAVLSPIFSAPTANQVVADDAYQVMRLQTNPSAIADAANRYRGAHSVGLARVSNISVATGVPQNKFAVMLARATLRAVGFASGINSVTAAPTSAVLSADGLTITVGLDMQDYKSLSDAGAELTGWEVVKSGAFVTINSARVSGSSIVLTLASSQTASGLSVRHLHNAVPNVTNIATVSSNWSESLFPLNPEMPLDPAVLTVTQG